MINDYKPYNLEPIFDITPNFFRVTLPNLNYLKFQDEEYFDKYHNPKNTNITLRPENATSENESTNQINESTSQINESTSQKIGETILQTENTILQTENTILQTENTILQNYKHNNGENKETVQNKIIEFIKINKNAKLIDIANSVGLSVVGVKYHISLLKQNGILSRSGSDKKVTWHLLK